MATDPEAIASLKADSGLKRPDFLGFVADGRIVSAASRKSTSYIVKYTK
jgi:hypothetical protein